MTADHLDDSITDDTAVRNFDRVCIYVCMIYMYTQVLSVLCLFVCLFFCRKYTLFTYNPIFLYS